MKEILEIKPLVGFGELKFGISQDEATKVLGEPEETETMDVEGDIHEVEVWSYWEEGHSLYFEKDLDNICTNFETDNEQATLFGEKVFELNKEEIIALMKKNEYHKFELEREDDLDEVILFFHDAHMQFVFEEDSLVLVSWGVAMDNENNILWP